MSQNDFPPPKRNHLEISASNHTWPHDRTLRISVVCRRLGEQQFPEKTQLFHIHGLKHILSRKDLLFTCGTSRVELSGSACDKYDSPSAIRPVDKCFYKIPARLYDGEPAAKLRAGSDLPACHRESSHWTPLNHRRLTDLLNGRQKCQNQTRHLKKHATVSAWGIEEEFFWTAALCFTIFFLTYWKSSYSLYGFFVVDTANDWVNEWMIRHVN